MKNAEALVFPDRCAVCDALIDNQSSRKTRKMLTGEKGYIYRHTYEEIKAAYDSLLCEECIRELEYIGEHSCFKCGKRLGAANYEGRICTDCSEKLRLFEQCFCVFEYNKTARRIAAEFKYEHRRDKLEVLSLALSAKLRAELKDIKIDALVPVPIHKNRLRERGYNQAEVIADMAGRALGIPVRKEMLTRNAQTTAQNKLDRQQRVVNLRQAFSVLKAENTIKSVLIVDDIYTTGATMEACTEALLTSGIKKVYGACIFAGPDR